MSSRPDDEGSVLVLTLGLAALLLVVVAIVVDVSAVVLARRGVASAADHAAVSAAQAVDPAGIYRHGLGTRLPLSAPDAAARVQAYADGAAIDQPGLRLDLRVDGDTAVVTGTRVVRPPFPVFHQGPVTVTVVARATSPVAP